MPNPTNVRSPIVLVGAGRSGTSLLSSLFERHSSCAVAGETVNLIFGVWCALWYSLADVPLATDAEGRALADDERAGRLVRQAFVATFPDDRPRWMQKPIGVPKTLIEQYSPETASEEACQAYWRVLRSSFPDARFVSIVRQPCDVVLSGMAHWRFEAATMWRTLADLATYAIHPSAPPIHFVSYERLVAHPEDTCRRLLEAVELPFEPQVMDAFATVHVPAPDRREPGKHAYTRRADWARLHPEDCQPAQRQALEALYARAESPLDWPAHWSSPAAAPQPPDNDSQIDRLEARVRQLNLTIERLHMEHAAQWRQREADVARLWDEQQSWIQELERVQHSHAAAVALWHEREAHVARVFDEQRAWIAQLDALVQAYQARDVETTTLWQDQQTWIAELERVKQWLAGQRDHWRTEAERLRAALAQAAALSPRKEAHPPAPPARPSATES